MGQPKTSRPFRERFLDGFDRSQLQQEVQRVRPKCKASSFRKRAASWGLGATLALGGLGIPLKMNNFGHKEAGLNAAPQPPAPDDPTPSIAHDLSAAKQIASQVATGVASGVQGAVSTVENTAVAAGAAARVATSSIEAAREAFFARQVPFGQIIYAEAKKNDLSPELVAAIAHTESQFIPTARSNRGAVGVMQLVPRTGRWLGAENLDDPAQNIMAGAKYLKYLSDRFGGDNQKVVAAYNAGEGNVRRFGGVPPFEETRDYVQRVASFQRGLAQQFLGVVSEEK